LCLGNGLYVLRLTRLATFLLGLTPQVGNLLLRCCHQLRACLTRSSRSASNLYFGCSNPL
jgi:hypothetical protein